MTPDPVVPGASPQAGHDGPLAPRCARCGRLHLPTLRCWKGRWVSTLRRHVFEAKGAWCWQCRREGERTRATTVDHVVARSRCGTDDLRNLEPACPRHNFGRGNRSGSPYPAAPGPAGSGEPVSGRFR